MQRWIRTGLLALAASSLFPAVPALGSAEAQILRGVRRAAERAAEREVERQVDRKVTETIRCAVEDTACADRARREGKQVEVVQADGSAAATTATAGAAGAATPATAFVNFDFVPGERVLFSEDYSSTQVGDFPRRLEFERGNMEVAEWQGRRWLRGTTWPSTFSIVLPEALPERFTLEMEIVAGKDGHESRMSFTEPQQDRVTFRYFHGNVQGGIQGEREALGNTADPIRPATPFMLRIMADGRYVKVYAGGTRIANMPNANLGRSNKITLEMPADLEEPAYVGSIRVAAGGRTLYDALSESGRVATQGIYFDTGSDVIRPESAPTLRQIGDMLKEHGDLKLTIEGHTDNVGDDAANQQLSERRAAAVKARLESEFGIAADRLEARGLGESNPAAGNDTPEGRQQNRRVELVRR